MGFLEGLVSIIAKEVAGQVLDLITSRIDKAFDRSDAFKKLDEEKTALAEEMRDAETFEERSAILDKIYEARPKFG